MGPLIPQGIIDPAWNNVIALLIGLAFGYILENSGFSSSRKIVGVFYGYDFTVIRVFMTACAVAMIGLLYFNYMGWMDLSLVFVNPLFFWATLIGSIIMGLGFVLGGYCPGTSIAGAGIGKIDGIVFTGGMFIGILIFSEAFPWAKGLYEAKALGAMKINDFFGISQAWFAFIFVMSMLLTFLVIYLIRPRMRKVEL